MIDSDGNMYLTFDSLIEINNITTGSKSITLRIVNVKQHGFDKIYIGKKSRFIKKRKVSGIWISLGLRTLLMKIPLVRSILF